MAACDNFECIDICGSLPEVNFSLCAPNVVAGQITDLYLTSEGNPLIVGDANEWGARIALGIGYSSRIVNLKVIGDKPIAESITSPRAYGLNEYALKTHSIPFTVFETSDANYQMMRFYERAKKGLAWYKTSGGKMFGGMSGIPVEVIINDMIPEKSSDIEQLKGILKFNYKYHPCRITSVL